MRRPVVGQRHGRVERAVQQRRRELQQQVVGGRHRHGAPTAEPEHRGQPAVDGPLPLPRVVLAQERRGLVGRLRGQPQQQRDQHVAQQRPAVVPGGRQVPVQVGGRRLVGVGERLGQAGDVPGPHLVRGEEQRADVVLATGGERRDRLGAPDAVPEVDLAGQGQDDAVAVGRRDDEVRAALAVVAVQQRRQDRRLRPRDLVTGATGRGGLGRAAGQQRGRSAPLRRRPGSRGTACGAA